MRLFLMIVGAFAAIICNERRADAQNYPWCAEGSYKSGGTNCGFHVTTSKGGPSPSPQTTNILTNRHKFVMPAIARHESVWRRSVDLQPASLLENAAVAAPFRIATELEFFLSRSDHGRVPANYSPASTQAIAATDRLRPV